MPSLVDTNRWKWTEQRKLALARDGRRCQLGIAGVCTFVATEVDHIVPRSLGGRDALDNLRSVCHPCHLGRGMETTAHQAPRRYSLPSAVVTGDYSVGNGRR